MGHMVIFASRDAHKSTNAGHHWKKSLLASASSIVGEIVDLEINTPAKWKFQTLPNFHSSCVKTSCSLPCEHSQPTASPQQTERPDNYKEPARNATGECDQPCAMLQENVTNHASDRGGMSCSPTETRVQLEVVILGIIS